MDFLAPRGVNRLSCASGAAFKDNWQLSQAQLGEFIFVLNRQAGLPLKMNIERLGRGEQRGRGRIASGGRLGLHSWQHLSGASLYPSGEPAFIFMAWGASGVVAVLSGHCPLNWKQQQHLTVDQQ